MIADNNNPSFVKSTMITYKFEEQQNFITQVFFIDNFTKKNVDQRKHIGKCYFTLLDLVRSQNKSLSLQLISEM